mgnify:CR=1 FL=1
MAKPSIYDHPEVYEAVVRAPMEQIESEVASIIRLLAQRGIYKGRVLELACGTCPHGILLARQGFSVHGVDLSPNILAVAAKRAEAGGVQIGLHQADIVDLHLDVGPFDCAIFMAETFPLITRYEDLISHFASVRRHLRPGGLYVVDVDAHRHGVGTRYQVWGEKRVALDDGYVDLWHEDFPGDWVQGTSHLVMHCRIHRGDSTVETEDEWRVRVDSPWHLELLLRTLPGWSLAGFYSWRDLSTDITDEAHYFMVVEALAGEDEPRPNKCCKPTSP